MIEDVIRRAKRTFFRSSAVRAFAAAAGASAVIVAIEANEIDVDGGCEKELLVWFLRGCSRSSAAAGERKAAVLVKEEAEDD